MTANPTAPARDQSLVAEMSELVRRLCLALTNVEMFGCNHPLAKQGVTAAYECIAAMFPHRTQPLVVTSSGKSIIMDGVPLEDKNPLVTKLATRLDTIHVNHLVFEHGLTADEFMDFFRVMAKGGRQINEQGGLGPLMEKAQIVHVKLREIAYVMVTGDEKVVSKDARIVEGPAQPQGAAESEIARYMVSKVMERTEEQQWLLNEMKNNPQKVADLIADGIANAASRMEAGMSDAEGSTDALLKNIRIVCGHLAADNPDHPDDRPTDLEQTVLTLENEIRMRSSKLVSSKVAQGFLNEILGIVTSYSDRARARRISDEFIKGETNLKRTEKLLHDLTPKDQSSDAFVRKIQDLLVQAGMSTADVDKLARQAARPKSDAPRRPRKAYSQAVFAGVSKRLKNLHIEGPALEAVTASLSSFIEDKAREKAGDSRVEAEALRAQVLRRNYVLDHLPLGILLWDADGHIEFVNSTAQAIVPMQPGSQISAPLRERLRTGSFPLREPPDAATDAVKAPAEIQLLAAVQRTVTDEQGHVYGVVFAIRR